MQETNLKFELSKMQDEKVQDILSVCFIGELCRRFCRGLCVRLTNDNGFDGRQGFGDVFVDLQSQRQLDHTVLKA